MKGIRETRQFSHFAIFGDFMQWSPFLLLEAADLSYSTVVLYRDHEGLGILAQNYLLKTSLIFVFWQFGSIG